LIFVHVIITLIVRRQEHSLIIQCNTLVKAVVSRSDVFILTSNRREIALRAMQVSTCGPNIPIEIRRIL